MTSSNLSESWAGPGSSEFITRADCVDHFPAWSWRFSRLLFFDNILSQIINNTAVYTYRVSFTIFDIMNTSFSFSFIRLKSETRVFIWFGVP